jgi:hypothetical protein
MTSLTTVYEGRILYPPSVDRLCCGDKCPTWTYEGKSICDYLNITTWRLWELKTLVCITTEINKQMQDLKFSQPWLWSVLCSRMWRGVYLVRGYACQPLSHYFPVRLILRPWRCKRCIPLKHLLAFSWLHGVMSQKVVHFNKHLDCYICTLISDS